VQIAKSQKHTTNLNKCESSSSINLRNNFERRPTPKASTCQSIFIIHRACHKCKLRGLEIQFLHRNSYTQKPGIVPAELYHAFDGLGEITAAGFGQLRPNDVFGAAADTPEDTLVLNYYMRVILFEGFDSAAGPLWKLSG
jgi:hypothetical protein